MDSDPEDGNNLNSDTEYVSTVDDTRDSSDLEACGGYMQDSSDERGDDEDELSSGENRNPGDIISTIEHVSETVDQGTTASHCPGVDQEPSVGASRGGHSPSGQLVPSTAGPVRPIGGSWSTCARHVARPASGDEVVDLVGAFVRRGEQSYDTTVETRGAAHNEVHVHLTQTNIHNPAAIALGGQVVVQPPKEKKTSETPQPPTQIHRLRGETERNFEKWTEGMVKTRATQTVLDKISQGRTWVTITGSPGEGKTTAGYLVLKHLHSMGRQVFDIKTPEDYFKVGQAKTVVMLNDIFGSLHFDLNKVKKWEELLSDVLETRKHKEKENTDTRNRKKPHLTVILISRSNILKEASHHLGKFRDLVLGKDCVVDI